MNTMSVDKEGVVTFYPPDPARDDKFHLEFWEDCLMNIEELEWDLKVPADFFRSSIPINIQKARIHCEERIKFYTHRPTVMRSG